MIASQIDLYVFKELLELLALLLVREMVVHDGVEEIQIENFISFVRPKHDAWALLSGCLDNRIVVVVCRGALRLDHHYMH